MCLVNSPTDIEVSLFLQQLINLLPPLLYELLDIHLLLLISGEGHVESRQNPFLLMTLQLLLVQIILSLVPTPKEQNGRSQLLLCTSQPHIRKTKIIITNLVLYLNP